jgi:hypothetical protein
MLIVVDLPAPFGPRNPNVSPACTSKSTPRTASTSPNRFSSFCTRMAGGRGWPSSLIRLLTTDRWDFQR